MYQIKSTYVNPEGLKHIEIEEADNTEWRDKKYQRQILRFYNFILRDNVTEFHDSLLTKLVEFCKAFNRSYDIVVTCMIQSLYLGGEAIDWDTANDENRIRLLRQHIHMQLPRSMGNKYGKEPYKSRRNKQRREIFDRINEKYNLGFIYEDIYTEEFK